MRYLILMMCLVLAGCSARKPVDQGGVTAVSATFFPVAEIVRGVAGDRLEVRVLLPPGADLHHFAPTVRQMRELSEVTAVFSLGHGAEPFLDTMLRGVDVNPPVVHQIGEGCRLLPAADDHDHDHGHHRDDGRHHEAHGHSRSESADANQAVDPHFWLSVANTRQMIRNVVRILSDMQPKDAPVFKANADAMIQRLDALDRRLSTARRTRQQPGRYLAVHNAFRYLAEEAGLQQVGIFEPRPGVETSVKELRELIDQTRRDRVSKVLVALEDNRKLVDSVARDVGLDVVVIDVITQADPSGAGLIDRLEANVALLERVFP